MKSGKSLFVGALSLIVGAGVFVLPASGAKAARADQAKASGSVASGPGNNTSAANGGVSSGTSGTSGATGSSVQPMPTGEQAKQMLSNPAGLASLLQQCYATLSVADHDYDGHREAAMKDISVACDLLGSPIVGQGAGHEVQPISDTQLRSVQMTLLSVARSDSQGPHHKEITNRMNSAINQITLALESETPHVPGAANGGVVTVNGNGVVATTGGGAVAPSGGIGTGPVTETNPSGNNSVEIAALENVYNILSTADHDYKGHRVIAMRAIERAVTTLGGSISGDGKGHEQQAASDEQLQQAQVLLTQVKDSFSTTDPKKVLKELTNAVNQLTTALATK